MSNIRTEYETIYILEPELSKEDVSGVADKVSSIIEKCAGDVLIHHDWGNRRLAYPIKRNQRGHYVYFNYLAPTGVVLELERNLRIQDNLLRFLTVRIAEDVDVESRMAEAVEQRKRIEEEEASRAAEEAARAGEERRARLRGAVSLRLGLGNL